MKTVFSPLHAGHSGQMELIAGAIVPGFEKPSRAEIIKARGRVGKARADPAARRARPRRRQARPRRRLSSTSCRRSGRCGRRAAGPARRCPSPGRRAACAATCRPQGIDALLGYYSFDAGASFVDGTWDAIKSSYDVALTAAALVKAASAAAFALCRPPGHHAGTAFMGGYCYINNAAVAAQWFRDQGAARVAILDVDYHHGNGTQEIFYARPDVLVVNLHGDPMTEYPFFLGHADERGAGAGRRLQPQLSLAVRHRLGASGALPWRTAVGKLAAYAPDVRGRVAGRRHVREGSDQPVQAEERGLSRRSAAASPGSACRRCSSWKAATPSTRSASTPSAC